MVGGVMQLLREWNAEYDAWKARALSMPSLKDGDIITWDEDTYVVVSYNPQDKSYWIQEEPMGTYYTMKLLQEDLLNRLWASGAIKMGRHPKIKGGADHHYHSWRPYKGFTEVYEYCDCGAKKETLK